MTTGAIRSRELVAAVMVIALLAVGLSSAQAYPRPGRTDRVPQRNNGGQSASISADGRYVAFTSRVALVPGDSNGGGDVFVADRDTGTIERVSVASDGTQGDCSGALRCSGEASISADGRYVAFFSEAPNLVPGDTNDVADTFLHDRVTEVTERVSVASDGTQGNARSAFDDHSITSDGRYVAFTSEASNLVPEDTNNMADVFVHDRATGATELISVASDGMERLNSSHYPSMSADGRYVAFFGFGPGLVPEDTNGANDIFVRDREAGTTERVSVASDGAEANNHSFRDPSISADGRYVAFYGAAFNLVPGDTNGTEDVFVHDRETGATERVSVASDGGEGNGASQIPAISPDGRYVAFHSLASNLVPGDTNGASDTFVFDRETRATERVSVASDGAQANSDSTGAIHGWPSISAEGRAVAFHTTASNLVPGDTNGEWGADIFVRDRGGTAGVQDLSAVVDSAGISVSGSATFTGNTLASAPDPDGDGISGAQQAGAELTKASLVYRPEQEDLLVGLRLASMPSLAPAVCSGIVAVPGVSLGGICTGAGLGAGAPAVVYGLEFELGGALYEVRALRAGATGAPPAVPLFALYRCDPVCVEVARLSGGIGTTGNEVLVSVPLSAVEAEEGAVLSAVRAITAVGEAAPGALVVLDEVDLPDAAVPAAQVALGVARAGTPASEVVFDSPSEVAEGRFSRSLDVSSLPGGDYDVWARACLDKLCGSASTPVTIHGGSVEIKDTVLELIVEGRGPEMILQASLMDLDSSDAISGRTIEFYSDAELIGSVVTGFDGVAIVAVPPAHRGANRTYEAVFKGDEIYRASSDSRSGRGGV